MDNLFLALALISLFILLPIGLYKPSVFKLPTRKLALASFLGASVIFLILFGLASDTSKTNNTNKVSQTENKQSAPATPEPQTQSEPTKTPVETFEDQIKPLVKNTGSTDFNYKGLDWSDSDTVKGSKMVTVKVGVSSFLTKDYFNSQYWDIKL